MAVAFGGDLGTFVVGLSGLPLQGVGVPVYTDEQRTPATGLTQKTTNGFASVGAPISGAGGSLPFYAPDGTSVLYYEIGDGTLGKMYPQVDTFQRLAGGSVSVPAAWNTTIGTDTLESRIYAAVTASVAAANATPAVAATSTGLGYAARTVPLAGDLTFSPDVPWALTSGQGRTADRIAYTYRRPSINLRPKIGGRGQRGTRVAFSGGGAILGASWPYSERALASDGTTSVWTGGALLTGWSQRVYESGGRGAGGCPTWRFCDAAQALITADVTPNLAGPTQTYTVDNVNGIDQAFFTTANTARATAGLPPILPTPIAVGDEVFVRHGMNPIDGREYTAVQYCRVLAVDTTAKTITLDRRAPTKYAITDLQWSFPATGPNNTYRYQAGGADNVMAHSIIRVDPALKIDGDCGVEDLFLDGSASTNINAGVVFTGAVRPTVKRVSGYATGNAVVVLNSCIDAVLEDCTLVGGDNAQTGAPNRGKLVEASAGTSVRIVRPYASSFVSPAFQFESRTRADIRDCVVDNNHPQHAVTSPVFVIHGKSRVTVDGYTHRGNGCALKATTGSVGTLLLTGRVEMPTDMRFRTDDVAPNAQLMLEGLDHAGTSLVRYEFAPAYKRNFPAIPLKVGTFTYNLPPGIIRSIIGRGWSNMNGVTSVRLFNGAAPNIELRGRVVPDGTGAAGDTKIYSTVKVWGNADVGVSIEWPGGNLDGSDWTAEITGFGTDGGGTYATVDDVLPQDLNRTTNPASIGLRTNGTFVAGQTSLVDARPMMWSPVGPGSHNRQRLMPGAVSQLVVVCDNTVDVAGTIGMEIEVFPLRVSAGAMVAGASTDLLPAA